MNLETYKGGRGNTATFTGLKLDTLENCRESYARVIHAYAQGEISENMARTLSYLFTGLLTYWKLEKDIEIEKRIEAIEATLKRAA